MMNQPTSMGYDMTATMFSPDGRIYQVEYARESVKRGSPAVGMKYKGGIILAALKRVKGKMPVVSSIEKVFQVDDHIGAVASGMVADTRVLVDKMRVQAQVNRTQYAEPIDVVTLAKNICDSMQIYTQTGGGRPYGTSFLIAGVDNGATALYETDPSGAMVGYKATAIGEGKRALIEFFEEKYKKDMKKDDGIKLILEAFREAMEADLTKDVVDLTVIDMKDGYMRLSQEEVKEYIGG